MCNEFQQRVQLDASRTVIVSTLLVKPLVLLIMGERSYTPQHFCKAQSLLNAVTIWSSESTNTHTIIIINLFHTENIICLSANNNSLRKRNFLNLIKKQENRQY